MNDDLISRQGAIEALLEKGQSSRRYKIGEIWELNFDEIREVLNSLPSSEKCGEWVFDGCGTSCSECGYRPKLSGGWNYCPVCGAYMRGEE